MATTDLEIISLEGCVLVHVPGPRFDAATAPAFKGAVVNLARSGQLRIVLSLARVGQIDSSGLGAIISLHKNLESLNGRIVLCDIPVSVQPVLKLTRLDRILMQAPGIEAAATLARAD